MERDDARAVLKRQIEARGELPVTDAIAALVSIGIQAEAEINAIIADAVGVEWAARRERGGVVLTPLKSRRTPSGLPWETTGDADECWCCGAEGAARTREGTRICEICWVVLEMESAK